MYHGEYTVVWHLGLSSLKSRQKQNKPQFSLIHAFIHLCLNSDIEPKCPVLFTGNKKLNNTWSLQSGSSQSDLGRPICKLMVTLPLHALVDGNYASPEEGHPD